MNTLGTDAPRPAPSRARRLAVRILGGCIAVSAIGVAAYGSISSAAAGDSVQSALTIVAPAAPGGGWDGLARAMQQSQKANQLVNNTQVVNMPGAGGTIALGNVAAMPGKTGTVLVGGTGLLAATIQFDSASTLDDITPLATVVEEYNVIVVPADSPHETLADLVEAWKADPAALPWSGGGSFDQLVMTDLALAAGIDPMETTYISSDGGGEAIQAMLNGTVAAAAGGYPDNIDQIEAGRLRALALVAPERIPGVDIPTAREQGFDITLTNWRSLHAPAGLSDADRAALTELVLASVDTPEWRESSALYHWSELVKTGEELDRFLTEERTRIERLYKEMGQ